MLPESDFVMTAAQLKKKYDLLKIEINEVYTCSLEIKKINIKY